MRTIPLLLALLAAMLITTPAATAAPSGPPGELVSVQPLRAAATLPGSVNGKRLTFWSTTAAGKPAVSSGAVYFPPGPPPAQGWPVLAWAHGTIGLADNCAYSTAGPGAVERDWAYLGAWLRQGYAIVAADYAGLGTPGNHPYLNGVVEAHNVVDSVKAARHAFPGMLAPRWAVIGQSQGGAAAAFTARHAIQFGGRELDFRGGVATGMPGHVEDVVGILAPHVPPVKLSKPTTAYVLYLISGLRTTYPELDINSYLTAAGRHWTDRAESVCLAPFEDEVGASGVVLGDLFAKPLAALPNAQGLLREYLGTPESGYERPLFIGLGLADTDIVLPATFATVAAMQANGQPITVRTYPTDHSGAVNASLSDSIPFVQRLFR